MRRRFGVEFDAYAARTPRFIPSRTQPRKQV
jgi:protein-S-isoprenylcysteine O-methyltransferase Ste14